VASQVAGAWKRLGDREAILLCEFFNNMDYGGLVPTIPAQDKSCVKSLLPLISPLCFRISYLQSCVSLLSRVVS
jgi:hypothetical protein